MDFKLYEVCFSDGYSICIKCRHKPTVEEATKFVSSDLKKWDNGAVVSEVLDCDYEYAVGSFDMSNYDNWPIF